MFTKIQEAQRERLRDKVHVKQIEKMWCEDHEEIETVKSNPRHMPEEAVAAAIAFIDEHEGHDTRIVVLNREGQAEAIPATSSR